MVKIFGAIFRFVTNFVYSFFKLKKKKIRSPSSRAKAKHRRLILNIL